MVRAMVLCRLRADFGGCRAVRGRAAPLAKPRPLQVIRRASGSAPDRIRTCDLRFRRPTLYPTELRAQAVADRIPVLTHAPAQVRHQSLVK
jgi:hypothetical protein